MARGRPPGLADGLTWVSDANPCGVTQRASGGRANPEALVVRSPGCLLQDSPRTAEIASHRTMWLTL